MANKARRGKCASHLVRQWLRAQDHPVRRGPDISMRIGIRHIIIQIGLASLAATASAGQTKVWAVFAPHATHTSKAAPSPPCEGDYCALNALQDLWKRDALKHDRPSEMNANSVILDRARFQKEADRFGAPDATAVFNYNILNSGICVGAFKSGAFGIHTC